ncbi:hypothetical protein RhiirA1_474440 [Rhizophagus irregularis]|uniref:Uncharacterized protein n=1 Tax=Rhizophagus irregularis TaxID=588596 RepID=A0A2N0QYR7_9GLOM|nr:hypothetical protein RhiirA1_474440 [Rhizophagus irregularis]
MSSRPKAQLNVIARGILIHPDLVNLWKQIGYYEICNDVNDLVMQGELLILFPPTPASDWSRPSIEMVISRPAELINLGFSLKDNVIIDALHMFEHRLNEIGDILWDAFLAIRSGENVYSLAFKFFREAFKPERNLKKDDLLNFLKSKFGYHEQLNKESELLCRVIRNNINDKAKIPIEELNKFAHPDSIISIFDEKTHSRNFLERSDGIDN